jgi:hypothetical protein
MNHLARIFASLVVASTLALAYGCGGHEASGGGGGGGNNSGGSSSTGQTCAQTCGDPSTCASLACACNDGMTVNTQSCNNGCCAVEKDACPGACSDHMGWSGDGSSSSGGGSSSSSGGMTSGASFGESCSVDDDCESKICFHVNVNDDTVLKCTKECVFGSGECGAGWDCAEITSGGSTRYLCILQ